MTKAAVLYIHCRFCVVGVGGGGASAEQGEAEANGHAAERILDLFRN